MLSMILNIPHHRYWSSIHYISDVYISIDHRPISRSVIAIYLAWSSPYISPDHRPISHSVIALRSAAAVSHPLTLLASLRGGATAPAGCEASKCRNSLALPRSSVVSWRACSSRNSHRSARLAAARCRDTIRSISACRPGSRPCNAIPRFITHAIREVLSLASGWVSLASSYYSFKP